MINSRDTDQMMCSMVSDLDQHVCSELSVSILRVNTVNVKLFPLILFYHYSQGYDNDLTLLLLNTTCPILANSVDPD